MGVEDGMGRARELHEAVTGSDEGAAIDTLFSETEPHMGDIGDLDEAKGGKIDQIATNLERTIGEQLRKHFPEIPSARQHRVAAEAVAAAKRALMMHIVER